MAGTPAPIFISHAHEDAELAARISRLIHVGCGLAPEAIFCSSVPGSRIPGGAQFAEHIRERLAAATLIVPLITPAYLDSQPCLCELGAAWLRDVSMFPLVVPPVTMGQLGFVLGDREARWANREEDLNDLYDRVRDALDLGTTTTLWEQERAGFLDDFEQELRHAVSRPRKVELRQYEEAVDRAREAERLARYGSITALLRKFWDKVRDAYFFLFTDAETFREEIFLMLTKEALDAVADAFTMLVGKPCRAGIKWLDEIPESALLDDWQVRDLVRSSNTASSRDSADRVGENTDFRSIIEDQAPYFFSNDLISDHMARRYENSHWTDEDVAAGNVSYASAVVAPVGRFLADPALTRLFSAQEPTEGGPAIQPELLGFLWVDTRVTEAFDESTDVQLLVALASGLYPVLSLYRDLSSGE